MTPAELRALAEAATHRRLRQCGPCAHNANGCNLVWSEDNHEVPYAGGDEVCATNADARYIAAASPSEVLGLLDRLEKAESNLAWLRGEVEAYGDPWTLKQEVERLRGALWDEYMGWAYAPDESDVCVCLGCIRSDSKAAQRVPTHEEIRHLPGCALRGTS